MRRRIAVLALMGALAAALAGCETYYVPATPAPPPPAPPLPRRPPVDNCGAASLQYLIGRPIADIPQTFGRHEQRVIGQGAFYEDHFNAERLTIIYDEQTGRITRVRCG